MSEQAAPTFHKPNLATDRPRPAAPIWHQIPAELQARRQWVLWRYTWVFNHKTNAGKWSKVPYQPNLQLAKTNSPRTWSSFADAKAAYLTRPDYFDGIGYVFSKDDPYCGVDFDHCLEAGQPSSWAAKQLAALRASGAYIEVSVSGTGMHAITRATISKGRKTPHGEIYDRGRFFTMSGQTQHATPLGNGQTVIDALLTELGDGQGTARNPRDGIAGSGDRAALLAEHPPAEWEAARELLRTKRELLIKRSERATQREGTQGFFAARLLWAELHQRWPHIGVYRADGSLDDSQARAVLARTLYGRGFTFPEYVVIMAHHFAAYCLAKWGTKEAWREELVALWANARDNTTYAPKAPGGASKLDVVIPAKPRGRASNHAEQVERVYQLLHEARAGTQALITTTELASEAGMHRVTLAGILAELRTTGRITTTRNGRYGGLVVTFSDVVIVCEPAAECSSTVAQTTHTAAAAIEETSTHKEPCVSSEQRETDYSSQHVPPLPELVVAYLDNPDAGAVALRSRATGESMRRHSAKHFAALVLEHYDTHYTADAARAAYKAEQMRRVAEQKAEWVRFFAQLNAMATPDLIAYIYGGCKREVAELARKRDTMLATFDRHKYRTRLKCAKQHLAWRGEALPAKSHHEPCPPGTRKTRRVACVPLCYEQPTLCIPPATEVDYNAAAASITERLRARLVAQQ